ncbi:venom dipeptidyl peptidase 4 isoform X2 [Cimex lectularius]|uniref:Venom dipeptidyl peptidase 4 n=1 Tax=Cimex lectularius TaxID=79782 RepID=A0A8I6RPI2_CIMLE|nr:venom dipeptidyl peptidase 4 isoform X2 [Cimex lectularius]
MTSGQLHIQPQHTMEVGNSNQVRRLNQPTTNGNPSTSVVIKNEELLSKGSKKRTTLLVLIVVLVFSVIAAVLYFLKPTSTPLRAQEPLKMTKKGISFKSFVEGEYVPGKFNGTWVSDYEVLYKSMNGDIMIYNAMSNKSRVLLGRDVVSTSFSYELSADRNYLLLGYNYQKMYRYTYLAFYNFVELDTMKKWPLTDMTGDEIPVQLVTWAPIGNAFVYVYMNDIYYKPSAKQQQEFRITRTGRPGSIYNGVPDWVYEEEIFNSNKALWFSPDGNYLAYATFNDSRTPVMNIPYYGLPGDLRYQYMQAINIRYPKTGRPNPTTALSLTDLAHLQVHKTIKEYDLPARATLKEAVLYKVNWAGPSNLIYIWMNRIQNEAEIFQYSTTTAQLRQLMGLQEKHGWVIIDEPKFSPNFTQMAMIVSFDQGNDSGKYRHLALVDLNDPNPLPIALTSGKFVVTEIAAFDKAHIYFMSNANGHPGELRVFRVPATTENAPHKLECISCAHDQTDMGQCLYSGATFSKRASYYVLSCAGPVVPEINIYKKTGEHVMTWNSNERLKKKLSKVLTPEKKYMEYEVAPGMKAQIQLSIPPFADLSGAIKYPLLVHVYGGPDSNAVFKRFSVDWDTYITVNKSIIYARIDGRGSGLKGDKVTFANYRQLGTYEVQDQINITRYLTEKLPYIDPARTAIWGWSYGGYVAAMALVQDSRDVFKCGISVAPVTDWFLYDTMYTERFMGLPSADDNLRGYEKASLFNKVDNFRKKKFMLIHGTLDDNVHYQHSMMLAKTLELKDILFEQQSYPDETHSLSDVRPHLYHSMEHFLNQCFKLNNNFL